MKLSPSPRPDDQRALLAGADEHVRLRRPTSRRTRSGRAGRCRRAGRPRRGRQSKCDAIRCATTSASVSEVNSAPSAIRRVAQLGPVLDDPVQDDVEALGGVPVRVGVRLGHAAVGGPARVADAGGAPQVPVRLGDGVAQVLEVADGVHAADRPVRDEREPCGVVAAVLQALKALEQEVAAFARPDVSDDPAHDWLSLALSPPDSPSDRRSPGTRPRAGPPPSPARAARCRTGAPAPGRAPRAPRTRARRRPRRVSAPSSAVRSRTRTFTSRCGSFSIAWRSARSAPCERLEREQRGRRAVARRARSPCR